MNTQRGLALVPASFFGMVLGLAGLGYTWRAAHQVWGLPHVIGEAILLVASLVWLGLIIMYARKWIVARADAIAEAAHPVQCCFIGLIGVATMLIAGAALPYSRPLAEILYAAGALYPFAFALWRTGNLWKGDRDIATTTAILYLPVVAGSFVTATIASALGFPDWGQYAFGCGLFTWFAVESVLLNRLYNAPSMAPALRPTLGVQLAPPTVGAVAYMSVTSGPPGILGHALIGYGLLQALVLFRLLPWIWQGAITPAYWAFSFGITALATAPLRMIEHGDTGAIQTLAPVLFVVANTVILVLVFATLKLLFQNKLFPRLQIAPLQAS